ncbi:hypothetical protein [Gilvibacter sediminis]|uniref:hypothetical protein n=1 Tax=Gilvibacter sediminis TaxID=379071 RepID=UPI0023504CA0|nr:hypothetical protein [Gilvibacter sediminis]MDC7997653.1 hypothetical protein [Gilvibacter sediminis]
MKITSLCLALLCATVGFAQNTDVDANQAANQGAVSNLANNPNQGNQFTGAATFYNPKFDREGSIYLFDGWDQSATIVAKGTGGSFRESNINFNIQRSMFERKVAGDSIVAYNFTSIEKIIVGGREFKSFYLDEIKRNKAFEVIYRGDDFTILKGYTVDILEASPNPMIARPRDKYIQRVTYYLETETKLEEFKLRKRAILEALEDQEMVERAKEYARKYDKSFSKEEDLKLILNYASRK